MRGKDYRDMESGVGDRVTESQRGRGETETRYYTEEDIER